MIRAGFLASVVAGWAVLGAVVAGGTGSAMAQTPPALAAAAPAAPRDADPVVAIVNGDVIRASDIIYLYQTLGDGVRQMSFDLLFPQLLSGSIERKIAAQKARAAQVDKRAEVQGKATFWFERVLEETLLNEAVETQMTPARLQQAYQELIAADAGLEEAAVKHMQFQTPEAALAVVRDLDNGGNYDQIMARLIEQGVARGGPINYFRPDGIIREFADAAFRMRPGEYSTTPVQTEFGFHIIYMVDRRRAVPPRFEDVVAELRDQLGREFVDHFYADLLAGAQVQKFNFDGTPTVP